FMSPKPVSGESRLLGKRPEFPAFRPTFHPAGQLPERFGPLPAPGMPFALDLSGTTAQFAHAVVTSLHRVNLPPPKTMTDARLKELHGIAGLTALDLAATGVTDQGLKELTGLELASLNLARTTVTDAGLKELKGLKNLTWLGLNGTGVTDAGLQE